MEIDTKKIIEDFVDYLMPELTPHEASMYIFLLRNSHLSNNSPETRIGQRRIAQLYGRGPKKSVPSRQHVVRQLNSLELKGCIKIGETNREGTFYKIMLPSEIPVVIEKITKSESILIETVEDYFHDHNKRKEIYDRDNWTCQYCGEKVTPENVTLDHYIPRCNKVDHSKDNLRTACLLCNSIKSGKTYEEAAISLLESIKGRRKKNLKT